MHLLDLRKKESVSAICSMVCSMVCWSDKNAPRSSDKNAPRVGAKSHLGKFIFALGLNCDMFLSADAKKPPLLGCNPRRFLNESGILWHIRKHGASLILCIHCMTQ